MGLGPMLRVIACRPSPSRQVEVAVGTVNGQRDEQRHRHDHDQRGAHHIARRDTDAGRSARSKVAEIGVDQQDSDRHQNGLQERPQQVDRVEERREVVVVQATRLAEQDHRGELTGEERQGDGDAVQRRDCHHPGHDPGADQVGNRPDRHRFQRVDFLVDPHGAQLRGDAGAKGGRQTDSSDDRRRDSNVDEGRRNPVSASMPILPNELYPCTASVRPRPASGTRQSPACHRSSPRSPRPC